MSIHTYRQTYLWHKVQALCKSGTIGSADDLFRNKRRKIKKLIIKKILLFKIIITFYLKYESVNIGLFHFIKSQIVY